MRAADSASPIDELCRLARLRLEDSARLELSRRLDAVMGSFASLRAVTAPAENTGAPSAACRLRTDEPDAPLSQDQALANASRAAAGCFLVPRVVEG